MAKQASYQTALQELQGLATQYQQKLAHYNQLKQTYLEKRYI